MDGVRRILDGFCKILDRVHRILDRVRRILGGVHRILGGASRRFEGVWGCTLTSTPHIQPLQGKRRAVARRNARDARYARDAAVAEEDCKAVRKGRQAAWGGGPGGMACLLVGGGWIFRVKNVL